MACEGCYNLHESWPVPIVKVDHFRELLEENAYSLTDRRGICDLILDEYSRSNV